MLLKLFSISTPIGELAIAKSIYQNCHVSFLYKIIPCDLFEHYMINFDFILSMRWLRVSYVSIDYKTCRLKFQFPNELIHEWKGSDSVFKGQFYNFF